MLLLNCWILSVFLFTVALPSSATTLKGHVETSAQQLDNLGDVFTKSTKTLSRAKFEDSNVAKRRDHEAGA